MRVVVVVAALAVLAGIGYGAVDGTMCSGKDFELSQLRPVHPSKYDTMRGGGFWKDVMHVDTELDPQLAVGCGHIHTFLWRVTYTGEMEGAVTALSGFQVEGGNGEVEFGDIEAVDFNFNDELNDPPVQPTVTFVAEKVEKPDAALPEGKYYRLTASGLQSGSIAVFHIKVRTVCKKPAEDVNFNMYDSQQALHEGKAKRAVEREVASAAQRDTMMTWQASIIGEPQLMCAHSIDVDVYGRPKEPFGLMRIPVFDSIVTIRQPTRVSIGIDVAVAPCEDSAFCDCGNPPSVPAFPPTTNLSEAMISYDQGTCQLFMFCFELYITSTVGTIRNYNITHTLNGLDLPPILDWVPADELIVGVTARNQSFFNVGPVGTITYNGTGFAEYFENSVNTLITSNSVTGDFVPMTAAFCDCIVTDENVPQFKWNCGSIGTTNVECTNQAVFVNDARCIEGSETPTGACTIQNLPACTFNPLQTEFVNSFRCDVVTRDVLQYTPYDAVCTQDGNIAN